MLCHTERIVLESKRSDKNIKGKYAWESTRFLNCHKQLWTFGKWGPSGRRRDYLSTTLR